MNLYTVTIHFKRTGTKVYSFSSLDQALKVVAINAASIRTYRCSLVRRFQAKEVGV